MKIRNRQCPCISTTLNCRVDINIARVDSDITVSINTAIQRIIAIMNRAWVTTNVYNIIISTQILCVATIIYLHINVTSINRTIVKDVTIITLNSHTTIKITNVCPRLNCKIRCIKQSLRTIKIFNISIIVAKKSSCSMFIRRKTILHCYFR